MSDNNNNKRPFLAFSTGTVKDGKVCTFKDMLKAMERL